MISPHELRCMVASLLNSRFDVEVFEERNGEHPELMEVDMVPIPLQIRRSQGRWWINGPWCLPRKTRLICRGLGEAKTEEAARRVADFILNHFEAIAKRHRDETTQTAARELANKTAKNLRAEGLEASMWESGQASVRISPIGNIWAWHGKVAYTVKVADLTQELVEDSKRLRRDFEELVEAFEKRHRVGKFAPKEEE